MLRGPVNEPAGRHSKDAFVREPLAVLRGLLLVAALCGVPWWAGAQAPPRRSLVDAIELDRVFGTPLLSECAALAIAEIIFRERYGDAALENVLPLLIRREGDQYVIVGDTGRPSSLDLSDMSGGKITMTIDAYDGRISDFKRLLVLPFRELGEPPPPGGN